MKNKEGRSQREARLVKVYLSDIKNNFVTTNKSDACSTAAADTLM